MVCFLIFLTVVTNWLGCVSIIVVDLMDKCSCFEKIRTKSAESWYTSYFSLLCYCYCYITKCHSDHNFSCSIKYLKKKPVRDLTGDQFLKLTIAVEDKLVEMSISEQIEGNTGPSYLEELKQLYQKVIVLYLIVSCFNVNTSTIKPNSTSVAQVKCYKNTVPFVIQWRKDQIFSLVNDQF